MDASGVRQITTRGSDGNVRSFLERIAVDAGADTRKRQGPHFRVVGKLKSMSIARGEQRRFALLAAMPDRPHGMYDVASRKVLALRQLRLSCSTASKTTTFLLQLRSGHSMNRAAHTAARKECFICGVHDGVDVQCRDVGLNRAQRRGHGSKLQPTVAGRIE